MSGILAPLIRIEERALSTGSGSREHPKARNGFLKALPRGQAVPFGLFGTDEIFDLLLKIRRATSLVETH